MSRDEEALEAAAVVAAIVEQEKSAYAKGAELDAKLDLAVQVSDDAEGKPKS